MIWRDTGLFSRATLKILTNSETLWGASMAIPENLKRAVRKGKVIPFVGAGVSVAVRRRGDGRPLFPSWKQLLERAADRLEANSYEPEANLVRNFLRLRVPEYVEAAKYACRSFAPREWYDFLEENFDPHQSEAGEGLELARAIWALTENLVITTNYDNVLSWTCPGGGDVRRWLVQAAVQQAGFLKDGVARPTVWHLHGGIEKPQTIILTPDGYSRLYLPHPSSESPTEESFGAALDTLRSVMRSYTLLFVGYSLDDREIGDQLRLISDTFEGGTGQHFMLVRAAARRDAEQRLSRLKGLIEFVEFEDFGEPLTRYVEELAGARAAPRAQAAAPGRAVSAEPSRAAVPPPPAPQILPLPKLDKDAYERLFIGRERLLRDIHVALTALTRGAGGGPRPVDVQLFWIHGFGGMGKSWLLRRAFIEAEQGFANVRLGLIDWDATQWRQPLPQPPIDTEQLFKVIAHRLAQLYGADALVPYWEAEARVRASRERYTELRLSFLNMLDRLVAERAGGWHPGHRAGAEGGAAEEAGEAVRREKLRFHMESVLRGARLWRDTAEALRRAVDVLRADPIRTERMFEAWAELVAGGDADCAAYKPGGLLAEALRGCLRSLAERSPLLLILDTCEVLPPELDWWLRQLLVPLLDGYTPLLVIVGSRQPPDEAIPEGRSEGWLAEVPDSRRRIIPFNEQVRFNVEEIGGALKRLHNPPPPRPDLAGLIHRATLGFPLALRALFDLHEAGDKVLGELSPFQEEPEDWNSTDAMRHVYELVSSRFLQHLERDGREEELRDVTALALFRKAREENLVRFWDSPGVRERLRRLERRYSLVAGGDLHPTVRQFLRLCWRGERPARVIDIARGFEQIVREAEPPAGPDEPEYVEWLLDRCEVESWLAGQDAFPLFARTLAQVLAHGRDTQTLAELANEIPATSAAAKRAKYLLASLGGRYSPLGTPDPEVLDWLNQQPPAGWTDAERASLSLLNGLALAASARHGAAVRAFETAFPALDGRPLPQKRRVAQAYLGAVRARGQSLVPEAEEAYKWAQKLSLVEPDVWDENYYWVIHNAKLYEEAVEYCRSVIGREPKNLSPRHYLGHVLDRHLKRSREAEEVFRQTLEIDDKDAVSHAWLGDLLVEQEGGAAEAEAEYRKAVGLAISPTFKVSVLKDLAKMLFKSGRRTEGWVAVRQAAALAPDDSKSLNSLAWTLYSAQIHLDEAKRMAARSVALEPDNLYALHTYAAILVRLDKWDEALPRVVEWVRQLRPERLREGWHDFQPLFGDALKNGRARALADALEPVGTDATWKLVIHALRAADGRGAADFGDLPASLHAAAAQLTEQLRRPEPRPTFPAMPDALA